MDERVNLHFINYSSNAVGTKCLNYLFVHFVISDGTPVVVVSWNDVERSIGHYFSGFFY